MRWSQIDPTENVRKKKAAFNQTQYPWLIQNQLESPPVHILHKLQE